MILLVVMMASGLMNAGHSSANRQDYYAFENDVDVGAKRSHLDRLDVVCSKDHMTVHMHFDEPFYGVVFSHAGPHHERCIHVGPRAGITSTSFHIKYDGCGTVEDLTGQFHENTIVIQFGEDILEAWDEAKRLRCEWLESFEKPSSKPTLAISDLDIVELNFQGDDIDCWMEIQEGKGPWARQVGGLVPIGSPLTLVIAVNDHSREFDMRVKRCSASDGSGSQIQLTDNNGCVLRSSLLTPFAKIRDFGGKATLVAYSHIYAFKFPDNLDVYVHCVVEVCRHGCPDSCGNQLLTDHHPHPREPYNSLESIKRQKLAELANSGSAHHSHHQAATHNSLNQAAAHHSHNQASAHHSHNKESVHHQPLEKKVAHNAYLDHSKESLLSSAQHHIHHISAQNYSEDLSKENLESFEAKRLFPLHSSHRSNHKEADSGSIEKSEMQSAESNIHVILQNIKNNVHGEEHSKFDSEAAFTHKPYHHDLHKVKHTSAENYHKIIGHDAHWNSGKSKSEQVPNVPLHIPSLKVVSYQPPQPEPAAWSADEVIPLRKDQAFHHHAGPGQFHQPPQPEPAVWSADEVIPLSKDQVSHHHAEPGHFHQPPQPEPAAWSADEVIPLNKDQVAHHHAGPGQFHQPPQPEPAAWSADEVIPLSKEQVFHHHAGHGQFHQPPSHVHTSHGNEKLEINHHVNHPHLSQNPKPEPGPWTLDDVKPLHRPDLHHKHVEKEILHEPKPEPASWSLEDVKPLSKEDLKLHSLNYKMKTQSHVPIELPIYKEQVHVYSTQKPSTFPQPVYVPKSMTNMPNMNGSMMMMMMPTLLPHTYQTARWPQKTTARFIPHQKHHYPYPIPQFSPRQQMMMSVIADRRMDGNDDLVHDENKPAHHKSDNEGLIDPRSSMDSIDNKMDKSLEDKSLEENSNSTKKNKTVHIGETFKASAEENTEVKSAEVRAPVSGFIAPALDDSSGDNRPESKERKAHEPRALNRRKRSEPVFGVKQKFRAISASDLAFEWNLTADNAAILKGRREEIIYGICMSPAGLSTGVGLILILTLSAIIFSVVLYEHSYRLNKKTPHLSLLSRTFNGRPELLYKVTRPHSNS